ncbi:MAG: ATP-binding cassette domain-containing protein [Gammaproteobacteria bacterium]|jgi:ABC-2 type transport system ATP-binding protein|nr:ATP-binding cassette domain-containing protein [Gammaproteobacteria bacterium]MBT3860118.1 ATP-binding cassette domain-containing protein [Gammaproteobacteria bacterium]MBT3987410.1 ATP-binding cassette domain-containing protein [Gammaproteobacteria bacterium]MBT4256699.1 ATP-binding cassette domain-containing protein [Gammaproteobacteria bacterium]MBT4581852.1 ATP-binding cassette domain-containing protein [Gammaproteobacteria bacterium]
MDRPVPNSVLRLKNVVKTYGDFTAVDGVSLDIPKGSIYGFLGPNGAGKTTTIRMILEIIKPSSGEISILGHPSALDVRNRIGYLPEEKGLYKKMKVWALIQYFAMLKGMNKQDAKTQAWTLLERYGLKDFAESKVESLSKGMGQKVQVLSAVAHDPELVILDEPFSGLDPVNQLVLEELIQDMSANGQTVIFSTHVMQHAERLCDHILLIAKGKKIFDGTIDSARATIPRRVFVETSDNVEPLKTLAGIQEVIEDETQANHWQLRIDEQVNPQDILRTCFEKGISLSRFEFTEPSLHDVFVHLVGDDAREHEFR